MKKLIVAIVCILLFSGCSAMQKKADGRYFDMASNNNSEASIWLERVVIDGEWNSGTTGVLGCGTGNINGGGGRASPSYNTLAPQKYIYLEWYTWHEMARMKAKVKLPSSEVVNSLLLNPPWKDKVNKSNTKSSFIIDFRPNNKVWIKLAKTIYPESQEEVMILAEGQGVKTDAIVTRYKNYKEGENYRRDCEEVRKKRVEKGYHLGSSLTFDKWYTDFKGHKGESK